MSLSVQQDDESKVQRANGYLLRRRMITAEDMGEVSYCRMEEADREHPADDSYWEVMQIDEYCPPKSVSEPPTDDVVPLARAINDMTVNFREQMFRE
ncbi:unnamed protein product [Arctogadus glacialis]